MDSNVLMTHHWEEATKRGLGPIFTLVGLTVINTALVDVVLTYSFDNVMFSLACVETDSANQPRRNRRRSFSRHGTEKQPLPASNYITSSVRSTLLCLQHEAGDFGFIRGLGSFKIILSIGTAISALVLHFLPSSGLFRHLREPFTEIVASMLLCQAETAWLHLVISRQSFKAWYRRFPSSWITLVRATGPLLIASAIASALVKWTQRGATNFFSWSSRLPISHIKHDSPLTLIGPVYLTFNTVLLVLSLAVEPCLEILLNSPVSMILVRLQASFLPADDDALVPMDRSFGRGPSSGILHQPRPLSLRDAYKSLDLPTYIRLAKLQAKYHGIRMAVKAILTILLMVQILAMNGKHVLWVVVKGILDLPIVPEEIDNVSAMYLQFSGKPMPNGTVLTVGNKTITYSWTNATSGLNSTTSLNSSALI